MSSSSGSSSRSSALHEEEPEEPHDETSSFGHGLFFGLFYRHVHGLRNHPNPQRARSSRGSVGASPPPALRILSAQQAQDCHALCRFCFEGADEQQQQQQQEDDRTAIRSSMMTCPTEQDYRLVAPCHCRGSSEYVHIACLRQWQHHATHASSSVVVNRAAHLCSVCTAPYALPPLAHTRRLRTIGRGTLLVMSLHRQQQQDGNGVEAGMFHRAVILLLQGTEQGGKPFGVMINKPLTGTYNNDNNNNNNNNNGNSNSNNTTHRVLTRKGGPVCGGRLGVLRYMILHTIMQQQQRRQQDRWISKSVFAQQPEESSSLQILHDSENVYYRDCSALLERDQVRDFQQALSSGQEGTALVFTGYCSWGRGQLEREVERGVWHLCHGTQQDVVVCDAQADNLWETLTHGDRLIPTEELYE
eukprot:scaffold6781_cov204-Amphora_coffeaeformis.AAC.9